MKLLICLLLLLAPAAASAQDKPRSIAECEKVKEDLAYNNCLASFGPKRGERPATGAAVPADADDPKPAVSRGARASRFARRGKRGRISATFDVRSGQVQRRGVRRGRARATRAYAGRRSSRSSRSYRRRR